MKKAMVFCLLGVLLLVGVGLVRHFHMFAPWERLLADKSGGPPTASGEMSWKAVRRSELVLGSFDLVNGLTKSDIETLEADRGEGFYYLLACLWLVLGLRFSLCSSSKDPNRQDPTETKFPPPGSDGDQ